LTVELSFIHPSMKMAQLVGRCRSHTQSRIWIDYAGPWKDNGDGTTLWIYLAVESRADAVWAARALAKACSDHYEDFDLWDGSSHIAGSETKRLAHLVDTAEEVTIASQQSVLDAEDALLRSELVIARSRKLLEATEELRYRLVDRGAQ
jgi:hypothetical protein